MIDTRITWIILASLGLSMAALSAREWIDVKGRKMQADFESFDPDANLVTLRKLGKVHKITLDQFNEKDVTYVKRRHARLSQKTPGATLDLVMDDVEAINGREEFIKYLYDRVPVFPFAKGKDGRAKLHSIAMKKNEIKWKGEYYAGFRFKMPEWLDGDFKWFHVLDKSEDRKDAFFNFPFNIRRRDVNSPLFRKFETMNVAAFRDLKARFPYSNRFLRQSLERSRVTPGQEYMIWIRYHDEDMVNLALSTDIDSPRVLIGIRPIPIRTRAHALVTENSKFASEPFLVRLPAGRSGLQPTHSNSHFAPADVEII